MIKKPAKPVKTSDETKENGRGRIRVTLSVPATLWPYFERQRKSAKHCGNRSSYIRSLILEQMQNGKRTKRNGVKVAKVGAKH
jgi:hypothetical protein